MFVSASFLMKPQSVTSKKRENDILVDDERIWWKVKPNNNPSLLIDGVISGTYYGLSELICQTCPGDAI